MNWSEWVLVYLGIGTLVVMVRWWYDRQEALSLFSVLVGWPVTLLSYVPYRIRRVLRERRRQALITQMVLEGKRSAKYARDTLAWKGGK